MFWLYVLVGVVLLLAVVWWMDRRRKGPKTDGGAFDDNINRNQGEGNARNYYAGPP